MTVEDILRYAFEKFDANEYDDAVKGFMAAYQASNDEHQKNDIYSVIFESFVMPNEEAFRDSYARNIAYK